MHAVFQCVNCSIATEKKLCSSLYHECIFFSHCLQGCCINKHLISTQKAQNTTASDENDCDFLNDI